MEGKKQACNISGSNRILPEHEIIWQALACFNQLSLLRIDHPNARFVFVVSETDFDQMSIAAGAT